MSPAHSQPWRCVRQCTTRSLPPGHNSAHVCVLYTATTAARVYGYNVVIPIDGVNTRDAINHDYALHQLQVIPRASDLITFSTEEGITFS